MGNPYSIYASCIRICLALPNKSVISVKGTRLVYILCYKILSPLVRIVLLLLLLIKPRSVVLGRSVLNWIVLIGVGVVLYSCLFCMKLGNKSFFFLSIYYLLVYSLTTKL